MDPPLAHRPVPTTPVPPACFLAQPLLEALAPSFVGSNPAEGPPTRAPIPHLPLP